MSRILFTGATGLVGTAVLQRIIAAGHSVVALSRNTGAARSGVQWLKADFRRDIRPVLMNIAPVDAVVHNAASLVLGRNQGELEELENVNCQASRILINWSVREGVANFIFSSSLSHIERPFPAVITENAIVSPTIPYSRSKYKIEQELVAAAQDSSLRAFVFRLSSPVSRDPAFLPRNVIRLWIEKAQLGEDLTVFGTGSRTQDFVCVDDIATAYEAALRSRSAGLYNIASGTALSMRELAKMIASRFGVGVRFHAEDVNEMERWNISIEKAQQHLQYSPHWTSRSVISELLHQIPRPRVIV